MEKTKFSIEVVFDKKVPVRYKPSATLQKGKKGKQKKIKVLGQTKGGASVDLLDVVWEQAGSGKKMTLAIKEVVARVVYRAVVWVDAAIDKKSECYRHVVRHENEHVQYWKDGPEKYKKLIVKAVADATGPQMEQPEGVALKDAAKFKAAARQYINERLVAAARKYGKKIQTQSLIIHTQAELEKTNLLCTDYL
jgi:hypothetical protein